MSATFRLGFGVMLACALGGVACGGGSNEQGAENEPEASQSSSTLTGTAYAIRSALNGLCFEWTSGSTSLSLKDCRFSNNANQKWGFPTYFNDFYVQSYFSSNCLSTWSGSTTGFPVKVETIGSALDLAQEHWHIPGTGGVPNFSVFKLQNAYTGRCVTVRPTGSSWVADEEGCVSSGTTNDAQQLMLDTFP